MYLREASVTYTTKRIKVERKVATAYHVAEILMTTGHHMEAQEVFKVLYLNVKNQVIAVQEIARGSVNSVDVHPRELFRGAIMAGAVAVILAHNHPSGDSTPSASDWALTQRMKAAGILLGIPVLDHVILGDLEDCVYDYCSMAEDRKF